MSYYRAGPGGTLRTKTLRLSDGVVKRYRIGIRIRDGKLVPSARFRKQNSTVDIIPNSRRFLPISRNYKIKTVLNYALFGTTRMCVDVKCIL